MPRVARLKGEFATYHIILRGNERKSIFLAPEDRERFLETLQRMKDKYNFLIFAYCLMNNHVHLIIYDNGNDISLIMKSINVSYAIYFNRKYKRVGHLFQDRYKSEIVDDDVYLIELSKYIHNNPVKAGIVKNAIEYRWSSFRSYVDDDYHLKDKILSTSKILGLISEKRSVAQKEYFKYVNNEEVINTEIRDTFFSLEEENRDHLAQISEAKEKIKEIAKDKGITVDELIKNKEIRNEVIRQLRRNSSLKLKEIGELMGGLSESWVSRILKG
ncbi:MAG TPA: transposase [Clostridia bacterium]|jgi:REP element-mobilizing transposase RayT|nr:transposase [Clostridia bacterium]